MHPIEKKFLELREKGEKALLSYMMVGYPDLETSEKAFRILLEEGTDILEVGYPFSDPVADGPAIQVAHEVALKNRTALPEVMGLCGKIKKDYPHVPILLMVYYNPIYRIGFERFSETARESGIDGLIIPDLPAEECDELKSVLREFDLSLVLLASPTTNEQRLSLICTKTDHMTYYVSVTGTTGARERLPFEEIEEKIRLYRKVCSKPVVVGFGVSGKEHSRILSSFADGVVVGSLFVRLTGEKNFQLLRRKVREIKEGTKINHPTTS